LDAIAYLHNQFANINDLFHSIVGDFTQADLTLRPAPEQNLVGYTIWHMPRTQDAHVHTWIRGVPEVAHTERWSHWRHLRHLGYGIGISLQEADTIASSVSLQDVLKYADAVHHEIDTWLRDLDPVDLDQSPDISGHLSQYPEYQTASFLRETEHLLDQPTWNQLMRPCIGHIHRHLGELEMIRAIIRTHTQY
jgi:hypothetical protein